MYDDFQEQDSQKPKHDSNQYATGMITISQVIDNAKNISDSAGIEMQNEIVTREFANLI